jgi:hypothetical protein
VYRRHVVTNLMALTNSFECICSWCPAAAGLSYKPAYLGSVDCLALVGQRPTSITRLIPPHQYTANCPLSDHLQVCNRSINIAKQWVHGFRVVEQILSVCQLAQAQTAMYSI